MVFSLKKCFWASKMEKKPLFLNFLVTKWFYIYLNLYKIYQNLMRKR